MFEIDLLIYPAGGKFETGTSSFTSSTFSSMISMLIFLSSSGCTPSLYSFILFLHFAGSLSAGDFISLRTSSDEVSLSLLMVILFAWLSFINTILVFYCYSISCWFYGASDFHTGLGLFSLSSFDGFSFFTVQQFPIFKYLKLYYNKYLKY